MTSWVALRIVIGLAPVWLGACGGAPTLPTVEPTKQEVSVDFALSRPAAWPALPADATFVVAARRLCLLDLPVDPNLPFVLEDRRDAGTAMVLFADATNVAYCGMKRREGGIVPDGGSGTQARWTPDIGVLVGNEGLTIESGGATGDWVVILGLAPADAATVRAVVDGRPVDAVLGGGMYSISWPTGGVATAIVALDATGHELSRIDGQALRNLFGCQSHAPACTPEP